MAPRKKTTPQPGIIINGQLIPWAFIMRIRKYCCGDWDRTIDVFWKAKSATGDNGIIRYIQRGLVPNDRGVRYALVPSLEFENRRIDEIRQWWKSLYKPAKKRGEPTAMREGMKAALTDLLGAL
jgi:hypothetical protein